MRRWTNNESSLELTKSLFVIKNAAKVAAGGRWCSISFGDAVLGEDVEHGAEEAEDDEVVVEVKEDDAGEVDEHDIEVEEDEAEVEGGVKCGRA